MRPLTLSLIILITPWLAPPSMAQSVKLPAELKAEPGEWVVVAAEIDGGPPKWRWSDGLTEVKLDALFGPEATAKAKGRVFKAKAGRYVVEAWNAKGDAVSDIAACVIVVGNPAPPKPPDPPRPEPDTALQMTLKQAYALEANPDTNHLTSLASLYRAAASIAKGGTAATWGQLWKAIGDGAKSLGVSGKLPNVQAAISKELGGRLPVNPLERPNEPFAADHAKLCEAEFLRVANTLDFVR